ncbi:MAG: hypothetical protein AVDCRST_MAG93-7567 [uncultured Chloroflexia bacterium]|uniref:Uncharacterized protein n=1 Tax=uncultured Chloroflexia bacterium TaxID=1672391 RepID=A0A6J4MIW0_9CHLR|nr:MAG: hypothetical protein AVDCRST_MAG93-7567 [uncultured Chloroflexia bacterium]
MGKPILLDHPHLSILLLTVNNALLRPAR